MSIFNDISAPVRILRSFFFWVVILIFVFFSSITAYGEGTEGNEAGDSATENGNIPENEEPEEEKQKIVFSKKIYHKHTGSSGGGGCYSVKRTGTKTTTEKCGGTMRYYATYDKTQCSKCGAGYHGDQSGRDCWHSTTTSVSYTYYDLGCNKGTDTLLGSLTVEKSTDEWVTNLTLTGSYENSGAMNVSDKAYIWNGTSATENSVYEVTASGLYTLQLNADSNANTGAAVVSVDVKNVDVTGPAIRAHTQEPQTDWTREGVLVTLTDVVDLQPDGSEGCGLHEMPYSYDGGENWTAENSCLYMENGVHSILVRDALENQTAYEVTFYNVDCFGPTIESVEYDTTKNIRNIVITVTASDTQPDGSEGIGLHEKPYSYDGGKTWTAENTLPVDRNGTIVIVVRDQLGNETRREEVITHIDCTGPEITYKMEPHSWTQKDVTLKLSVKDINEDGSEGIGPEEAWYSLDGGETWSGERKVEFDENQTITVIARDKHNNRSSVRIKIKQIDRENPLVSVRMETIGSGQDMVVKLIADAKDEYSGLHEKAYSWDRGCNYGTDNTKVVKENGTYQITVRDNALNWSYALIDVDVFPIIEIPAVFIEETTPETEEIIPVTEEETEEETTEEHVVIMEERIEKPKETPVTTIEEKGWDIKDALAVAAIVLFFAGLLVLLLLICFCTIRVYAENKEAEMDYMGRLWIRYKEEHFEVEVPAEWIEKCMTTHFLFCPGVLFSCLFREKEIAFLFPEEICVIKKVEENIEISLL